MLCDDRTLQNKIKQPVKDFCADLTVIIAKSRLHKLHLTACAGITKTTNANAWIAAAASGACSEMLRFEDVRC
jgi:hypothetical protein